MIALLKTLAIDPIWRYGKLAYGPERICKSPSFTENGCWRL